MKAEIELIHRLLDGELSSEEEKDILERLEAEPAIKREFDLIKRAVGTAEACEEVPAPPGFTRSVMMRLPGRKKSLAGRLGEFFFGERVARWNVATALATASFLIVVVGSVLQFSKNPEAPVYRDAAMEAGRMVSVSYYAPQAKAVSVAGDFNKWSTDAGAMKRNADGSWTIELPLKPGVYHYMFVVDGEGWVADPKAEAYRDDGFGNRNAVMRVNEI